MVNVIISLFKTVCTYCALYYCLKKMSLSVADPRRIHVMLHLDHFKTVIVLFIVVGQTILEDKPKKPKRN